MVNHKFPEAIFIQLNTYCNATCINCPHIFTYKKIHPKGRMNEKTWQKILSDLIAMDYRGQVGFYLHHEPLIDVTLYDKIKDVNSRTNAFVVISTNGSLLNDENRKKLIDAKPQKVHININSGIEKEYEKSMGLNYKNTIKNVHDFIQEAKGLINIEINCPVMEGYNVKSLEKLFPSVNVNLDYYANSRGGLLPDLYGKIKGSRFKIEDYCVQPSQNFNILFDGSVIVCCIDWMHESKNDYGNVNDSSIEEIYSEVCKLEEVFKEGDYSKYKMCESCSSEMGFNKKSGSDTKLKILITNHHLLDYCGSEILTYTLADYLSRNGHQITVYSKFLGSMKRWFDEKNIRVVDNLKLIAEESFDVAHIQHNISAIEVREKFPEIPLVFYSQGVLPFLEQPPQINVNINKYIAISEEVRDNLISLGIPQEKIDIVRNIVDSEKFSTCRDSKKMPKNVLVISARMDQQKEEILRDACQEKGLNIEFVGRRFGVVDQSVLKGKIEWADIVVSLGRGAIEGMIAGRAVIIYDYLGGDGLVTDETYSEIQKHNFSGRRYRYSYIKDDIIREIEKYDFDMLQRIKNRAIKDYAAINAAKKLEAIYWEAVKNSSIMQFSPNETALIGFINCIIRETYNYSFDSGFRKGEASELSKLENHDLELAEVFINNGQYNTAKDILNEALKKNNSNIDILNDLAVVNILESNYENSIELIKTILSIDPANEIALGNLDYILQELPQEVTTFKESQKSDDNNEQSSNDSEKSKTQIIKEHWDNVSNTKSSHNFRWWGSPTIWNHYNRLTSGDEGGLIQLLKQKLNGGVLEKGVSVGCGIGVTEMKLILEGVVSHFDLYELSEVRIKQGLQRAKELNILDKIAYHNEDVFQSIEKETVELVYWYDSLHHMFDVDEAVKWCRQILKNDGFFCMNEYTGPSRFQFSDKSLEIATAIRSALPTKYMVDPRNGSHFSRICYKPSAQALAQDDPSEAADSSRIIKSIQKYFPHAEIKKLGGIVYMRVLDDIICNFNENNKEDLLLLKSLLEIDKALIQFPDVDNLYSAVVVQKTKY